MKVVCKWTSIPGRLEEQYINLTQGQNYTALSDFNDSDMMVELVDDAGDKCWYPKKNFKTIEEVRDEKLQGLGI